MVNSRIKIRITKIMIVNIIIRNRKKNSKIRNIFKIYFFLCIYISLLKKKRNKNFSHIFRKIKKKIIRHIIYNFFMIRGQLRKKINKIKKKNFNRSHKLLRKTKKKKNLSNEDPQK